MLLASQGISGSPVGAEAHFAGGMMFTAELREANGEVFLHSTASRHPSRRPSPSGSTSADAGDRRCSCSTPGCARPAAVAPSRAPALQGIVHVHADWMSDPTVEAIDDEDEPDDDGGGFLDFEGGHGTFISGIVRQLCPDAEVAHGRRAVQLRRR